MSTKSKEIKSLDQAISLAVRICASISVALSGFMLFSDKVLTITLDNNFGFQDTQTFLWVFTQSVSPFFWAIGNMAKAFKIVNTIPIYFYTIQLIWVFQPHLKFDDVLLQVYATGTVLFFIISALAINTYIKRFKSNQERKISFLTQALDLSINISKTDNNE